MKTAIIINNKLELSCLPVAMRGEPLSTSEKVGSFAPILKNVSAHFGKTILSFCYLLQYSKQNVYIWSALAQSTKSRFFTLKCRLMRFCQLLWLWNVESCSESSIVLVRECL